MTQSEIRGWGLAVLIFWVGVIAGFAAAVYFNSLVLAWICAGLYFLAIMSFTTWHSHYEFYRDRKPRVRRYQLERDIESLEVDLGIGLGEDWWRPDGVLTTTPSALQR